eukprot:CAMPEP_0175149620 /NCGR_PEP_ID=MMETSP0087-20121206/17354_1 /TAXON_ID=136419 /ORGANISM="Unknown Unknown, Strain D1" /LENGTH=510 /DNA_ID=CAMNT_0016435351 /DNA_START=1 /DNA_END=1533 /DNA_ORIENTATION=-
MNLKPDKHGLFYCKNFYEWHKKFRQINPVFQELWTKCLYDVLGVSRNADKNSIKRAFRKAARQHHPDKGGDPEVFKELNEAYEVLCDEEKRQMYDQFGENGLPKGQQKYDFDEAPEDKEEAAAKPHSPQARKAVPVITKLQLSLEEVFSGVTRNVKLSLMRRCRCKEPKLEQDEQIGECTICNGKGTVTKEEDVELTIPAGVSTGQRLVLRGAGNQEPDHIAGDIVVIVQIVEHAEAKVSGSDLFYNHSLSFQEATSGFNLEIKHLSEHDIKLSSVSGKIYKSGDVQLVKGKGMPTAGTPGQFGNMYVEFNVKIPAPFSKLAGLSRLSAKAKTLKRGLKRVAASPASAKKSPSATNAEGFDDVPDKFKAMAEVARTRLATAEKKVANTEKQTAEQEMHRKSMEEELEKLEKMRADLQSKLEQAEALQKEKQNAWQQYLSDDLEEDSDDDSDVSIVSFADALLPSDGLTSDEGDNHDGEHDQDESTDLDSSWYKSYHYYREQFEAMPQPTI